MKIILLDPLIGNKQLSNYTTLRSIPNLLLSKKGILYQEQMTDKFSLQIGIDEVKILNNPDRLGTPSIRRMIEFFKFSL